MSLILLSKLKISHIFKQIYSRLRLAELIFVQICFCHHYPKDSVVNVSVKYLKKTLYIRLVEGIKIKFPLFNVLGYEEVQVIKGVDWYPIIFFEHSWCKL